MIFRQNLKMNNLIWLSVVLEVGSERWNKRNLVLQMLLVKASFEQALELKSPIERKHHIFLKIYRKNLPDRQGWVAYESVKGLGSQTKKKP